MTKTKTRGRGKSNATKRYTKAQKQEVLDFVRDHDDEYGTGGITAASKRFGPTPMSIRTWMKANPRAVPNHKSVAAGGSIFDRFAEIESRVTKLESLLGI